mgnify:CR=1 FL=1|tara:strand:- start:79 stop:393 length:315 start_codon:yes stop_codon:yes gene_type:complete
MSKYKNKDGINLNYAGSDSHKVLVKEVVEEAIKILSSYRIDSKESMSWALHEGVEFLKENFDIGNKNERSDEWRIKQFNRNRSIEDQVLTIEELEEKVDEIFNS